MTLTIRPLPLPSIATILTYMMQSSKYIPATSFLTNYPINLSTAQSLFQIAHDHDTTTRSMITAIFFDSPAPSDAYDTVTYQNALAIAETTRRNLETDPNEQNDTNESPNPLPPMALHDTPVFQPASFTTMEDLAYTPFNETNINTNTTLRPLRPLPRMELRNTSPFQSAADDMDYISPMDVPQSTTDTSASMGTVLPFRKVTNQIQIKTYMSK